MPRGKHREDYRRKRKGERREVAQPTAIEKLPADLREAVRNAMKDARAGRCGCRGAARQHFHIWEELAGLVNRLLERAKHELRVSATQCHRDYDLYVAQAQQEVNAQAERARIVAAALAARAFPNLDEAALNLLAVEIFGSVEARTPQEREAALMSFGVVLAKLMTAQTGKAKLGLEQEKIKLARQRLEQMRSKIAGVKDAVAGKKKVSNEELVKKLDEIYGLTQPNS